MKLWISTLAGRQAAQKRPSVAALVAAFAFLCLAPFVAVGTVSAQPTANPVAAEQPDQGHVPGNTLGTTSDSDYWRAVREGVPGLVSIPDKNAATLVQSEGELWRSFRNGPLALYASWVLVGMIVLLCLFYAIRGRIRIDQGRSGELITRFVGIERFGHWLIASSFIILALSGLNVMYGRYVLLPVIGAEAFGFIAAVGKYLHNYLAFAFMAGLAMIFLMWVRHNLPDRTDIKWVLRAGGLLSKNNHPPAKKFNAGQKVIFWSVIVLGTAISVLGWALLFPFTTHIFSAVFSLANTVFGTAYPVDLAPLQEQQLASVFHAALSVVLIAIILGHIYIGSIGMEGAFDAMGSGEVDLNWAKEHHSLWVEEVQAKEASSTSGGGASAQPAE